MLRAVLISCIGITLAQSMAYGAEKAGTLQQYALPDPYLKCTAWTFVAPADWKQEGGVSWNGRLTPLPVYSTSLVLRSPDGSLEYRLFPIFCFTNSNNRFAATGEEVQPVMAPAKCIEQIILPRCRAEAREIRAVAGQDLPELSKQMSEELRASGLRVDAIRIRAGRLLVEYSEQGQKIEEMVYCITYEAPGMMGSRSWGVERAFSYRAAKGKLQEAMPLLGTIGRSLMQNPQWVVARRQRMQQLVAQQSPPPQLNTGRLSILDVSRQMARDQDSFLRGVDASIAARDHAMDTGSRMARNTQMMNDPVLGEQVEVGNGYLYYYRDYYGKVHGSDLSATDFYTQYQINTTELQPQQ